MKRILFLNSEFPPIGGGASPASYDIALKLSQNGYAIDVLTSSYKNLPAKEVVNENFVIYRTPSLRSKKEIAYPYEQLSYLISGFFTGLSLIKKNKYDLLYAHFIIPTGALALVLSIISGIKYIVSAHGSDVIGHNKRFAFLYKILLFPWKLIVNKAKLLTVPSQHLVEKVIASYPEIDQEKLAILPNIVKKDTYKSLPKEKYILTMSRVHELKGIQDLLTAFARTKHDEWRIKIAGDGPFVDSLKKLTIDLNINKDVDFVGWIGTQEKKQSLYGHAAIYVNPSHAESFGITTIEAMQAGCYCIISETGIAKQLHSVPIFAVRDVDQLAKHLQYAFDQKELPIHKEHEQFYEEAVEPLLLTIIDKAYATT